MKTHKKFVYILVTLLILVSQLAYPTLAYADDEPPATPTKTNNETPPPTQGTPTEAVPTETPVPSSTEEPTVTETPTASDSPTVDPVSATEVPPETVPAEEPSLTETLAELPAETDVVVLDENGQPLPLVTEEAAEIIAQSDPLWCPAHVTTVTADCVNAATVTDLLPLLASKDQDGIIYFTSTYNTSDVTFNGDGSNTNIDQLADNTLTLQGGWDGVFTLGSTITFFGNSIFTVPISISNWGNDVTINNITVDGGTGSNLYMNNNVTVRDSQFNNSTGPGLQVNSNYGDLIIENSEFNNNTGPDGNGLFVNLNGAITLNNISANNNAQMGALIRSYGNKDILLGGITNTFIGNKAQGLDIANTLNGNITVENVTATGNGENIPNYYSVLIQAIDGTIALNNVDASSNKSSGMYVGTKKNVTLNSITANGNLHKGLETYSEGTTSLTDITANNNGGLHEYGVYTYSYGNIAINNIVANENGMYGVISTSINGNISLTNGTTNNNFYSGVILSSMQGTVTINNVAANENGMYGLYVSSNGNTTMSTITTIVNGHSGVFVFTPQNATINATTIQNNTQFGVDASAVCGIFRIHGSSDKINPPVNGEHIYTNPYTGQTTTIYCKPIVYVDGVLIYGELDPSLADQYEFELSCATQSSYPRTLTNGDQVEIICPVKGKAILKRLENTSLVSLPPGHTYVSAFSLDILQNDQTILYIGEGGHVNASFKVPAAEPGTLFSVLYWDDGRHTWTPLKEFVIDENGKALVFPLYPDDPRLIISGLHFVTVQGVLRAEFSTNFPGTFVLVQQ
jgi:hypothetical protein